MRSSSPEPELSLRELQLLEAPGSLIEISPRWRLAGREDYLILLDPRGPTEVVSDAVAVAALKRLVPGPQAVADVVELTTASAGVPQLQVVREIRALLARRLLRVRLPSGTAAAALDGQDALRFSCQLAYFRDFERPGADAAELQRRLIGSSATIIGLGGLGGLCAQMLLAAGVRRLTLVDGDQVALSNLPRQFFFRENDVGSLKTQALARALKRQDSRARVRRVDRFVASEEDASSVVGGAGIVLLCADSPAVRIHAWVGEACLSMKVPYLAMAGPWVGPLFVPSHSPCYMCQSRFNARELSDAALHLANFLDQPQPTVRPAFAPGPALAASLLATAAIEYLAGISPLRLANKRIFVDVHGNRRVVEVPRYLDCSRCAGM